MGALRLSGVVTGWIRAVAAGLRVYQWLTGRAEHPTLRVLEAVAQLVIPFTGGNLEPRRDLVSQIHEGRRLLIDYRLVKDV